MVTEEVINQVDEVLEEIAKPVKKVLEEIAEPDRKLLAFEKILVAITESVKKALAEITDPAKKRESHWDSNGRHPYPMVGNSMSMYERLKEHSYTNVNDGWGWFGILG